MSITRHYVGQSSDTEYKVSEDPNTVLLLHGDKYKDYSMYDYYVRPLVAGVEMNFIDGKFNKCFDAPDQAINPCMAADTLSYVNLISNPDKMFTVEWWEKPHGVLTAPGSTTGMYWGSGKSSIALHIFSTTTNLNNFVSPNSSNWSMQMAVPQRGGYLETWTHIAFVRDATGYHHYQDGVEKASNTNNINPYNVNYGQTRIMGNVSGHNISYWASMCEFRLSKIARYTGNFNPPGEFTD